MEIKVSKLALKSLEEEMENDELQEFLDLIKKKFEDGSFIEDSEPVDFDIMQIEEPELYAELMKAINSSDIKEKLN